MTWFAANCIKSYPADCSCQKPDYQVTKLSLSEFKDFLSSNTSSTEPLIAKFKEACKQFDTDLIDNGRPTPVTFTLPKVYSA